MFTDFQVVVAFSEDVFVVSYSLQEKCCIFTRDDVLGEFTREVARESYGIWCVFFERCKIYLRLISDITIEIGTSGELDEVFVAVKIFCEEDEAVDFCVTGIVFLSLFTDKDFYTDDRLDTFFLTEEIKFKCPVEIVCISDGECWHPQFFCTDDKSLWVTETLKK